MSRNASNAPSKSNRVEQEPLNGSEAARIVQVVFLGVQPQNAFKGQPKPDVEQVRITYELSHRFMVDEEGNTLEDKPRWENETIPWHPASVDLATSTKRFISFNPGIGNGDHVWSADLLGKAVSLTLASRKAETGKHAGRTFVDIKGVTPAPTLPGYVQPELINPAVFFDPADDNLDIEVFNGLPDWLQAEIKSAKNFSEMPIYGILGGANASKPPADAKPEDVEKEQASQAAAAAGGDDSPY